MLGGNAIGKLAPQPPNGPRLMVGFSTAMQCPDIFAGCLDRPEPYELGPSKEPFLMVECNPAAQIDDICDVMAVFFVANGQK